MERPAVREGEWRRRIGSYGGTEPGRTVLAVCGIHGNEPAGVRASETILEELARRRPPFRGEFVALAGNLEALARNQRYVARDLNRQWTPDRVDAIAAAASGPELADEDREQHELWREIDAVLRRSRGPAIFLDLHTSSAAGAPFATMGDTLRNRRFLRGLPIPVIMGLEEVIDGSLLEFVNNLGHVTAGVEGGRHDLPTSVQHHIACLWLLLVAAGNLDEKDVSDLAGRRELLARATQGIPKLVEVRYRHALHEGDGFRMKPGYTNFDPVAKGEIVGADARGAVRTREAGRILLPLYQERGNDGFFLGRAVSPLRLRLSSLLRRLRAHSLPRFLPGVQRHPEHAETVIVTPRAARVYPSDLFPLLGFRKRRWREGKLFLTRRREEV